jgi:hypothetical protein
MNNIVYFTHVSLSLAAQPEDSRLTEKSKRT